MGIFPSSADAKVVILVAKYRKVKKIRTLLPRIRFSYHQHDFFTQSLWDHFIESDLYDREYFLNFCDFKIPKVKIKLYRKEDGVYQTLLAKNFWQLLSAFRFLNEYVADGKRVLRMTPTKALAVLLHCNFCKQSDLWNCPCDMQPIDDLVCVMGKMCYSVNLDSPNVNLHTFRAASLNSGQARDGEYNLSFNNYFRSFVGNQPLHVYELFQKKK